MNESREEMNLDDKSNKCSMGIVVNARSARFIVETGQ